MDPEAARSIYAQADNHSPSVHFQEMLEAHLESMSLVASVSSIPSPSFFLAFLVLRR